ncbi:universal stress protein [Microbacterium hominis]|uniref:Universal stress protein n=1 Tax=Microbacterium hominis TaxID=162426 RepID=A0A7D4PZR5_9MICO|nr:universal stress protein [Microbacterium hominis]QKJ18238.1 universal stress protein [Microbacterium hominis]
MVRIAVGYDGSAASRAALEWAASRALRGPAHIDLVTVTGMITSNVTKVDRELHDVERRIHDMAPGVLVESRRIDGSMPATLLEDTRTADILAVGIRRGQPVRAALTGWMPLRLAARAKTPVCLVPDDWTFTEHAVTVGVDDDPSSDRALDLAAAEAASAGAALRVTHAWTMPTPQLDGAVALLASPLQVKEEHRKVLRDAVRHVAARYPQLVVEEALVADNPSSALLQRAPRSSLLVIGTHGRGLVTGGILGSVAQDVLGRTDCPVLIVPAT